MSYDNNKIGLIGLKISIFGFLINCMCLLFAVFPKIILINNKKYYDYGLYFIVHHNFYSNNQEDTVFHVLGCCVFFFYCSGQWEIFHTDCDI